MYIFGMKHQVCEGSIFISFLLSPLSFLGILIFMLAAPSGNFSDERSNGTERSPILFINKKEVESNGWNWIFKLTAYIIYSIMPVSYLPSLYCRQLRISHVCYF